MRNQSLKRRRLHFGIGNNDADYPVNASNNMCPYFRKWIDMLSRCYSGKSPAYDGCTVTPEWHDFMAFRSWMQTQPWNGKALDKDYLVQGNKVYGPDTCVFVNQATNNFNRFHKVRDLPTGVNIAPSGRFVAYTKINGRFKRIGTYDTKEEAQKHWFIVRAEYALEISRTEIDERVVRSLVKIHDDYLSQARLISARY